MFFFTGKDKLRKKLFKSTIESIKISLDITTNANEYLRTKDLKLTYLIILRVSGNIKQFYARLYYTPVLNEKDLY